MAKSKAAGQRGGASDARLERKPVTLALQGGGSHGAFTWGVLERFLAEDRLQIEAISGTSAGAMNGAVIAEGLVMGDRAGAISELERFWAAVSRMGRFGPFIRTPVDAMINSWNVENTPGYLLFDTISRYLSPYQFNPFNWNPLLELLAETVDFDLVRACDTLKLFVTATSVQTGKIRVFTNEDLTPEAVMASGCLPQLFQAVEIDGEAYWDGGYMGNPAIFPLIYNCESRDVIIVQVNPLDRPRVPTTIPEITDRLNEITFNATLMREMRAIAFVSRLLEEHQIDSSRYKKMLIHRIDIPEDMKRFSATSKLNAEWDFINYLRTLGYQQAEAWLQSNFDALGKYATVDVESDYL